MFKLHSKPFWVNGGCQRVMGSVCQLFLVWLVIAVAGPVYAGDISVLAPFKEKSTLKSRNRVVGLVVKVVDSKDLDSIVLRSERDGRIYDPVGRYEKDGVYYVHYSVHLKKGKNNFILDPVRLPIKIKYAPLSSVLNLNFNDPALYLFHKNEVVPAECATCHNDKLPAGVNEGQSVYGEVSAVCYSCHQGKVEGYEWKHFPASSLLCRACHQGTSTQSKAEIPSGKVEVICFGCHVNQKKWLSMSHIHGPVGTGDCTICHDPHGSNNKFQLWTDGKAKLCVVCHEDKKKYVSSSAKKKLRVHGILSARGCVVCHSPHASDHRFQLLSKINELCVSCHVALKDIESGHPVANHPLKGVENPLRPGISLSCTSCHNPHGSNYEYLLIGDVRGGMVCAKCHSGRKKKSRRSSRFAR